MAEVWLRALHAVAVMEPHFSRKPALLLLPLSLRGDKLSPSKEGKYDRDHPPQWRRSHRREESSGIPAARN